MQKLNLRSKTSKPGRINQYLFNEIMEATPKQLILKIYDVAVINCQRKNLEKTNQAIQELINSLRFDDEEAKEISVGLLKLYQFCQEQARKGDFNLVYKILSELRESWLKAFSK